MAFLSTLSDPRLQVPVTRQHGRNVLNLTQPHAANEYNKYMNGVDRHGQLRMKYSVGRDSKKAWKYIFHFILNCAMVNAFIIFSNESQRRNSKKRFTHVDFRLELAQHLIAGFSGRKRKSIENREVVHEPQRIYPYRNKTKMQSTHEQKGKKRDCLWMQSVQCTFVQRWMPLCIPFCTVI